MPSMHFGWTALVGLIIFRTGRPALRILGVVYPALMFIAVIVTGNHYVVDPIAGGLVLYVSLRIPGLLARREAY
jgi:membrane-associated phospholipid phosphatase